MTGAAIGVDIFVGSKGEGVLDAGDGLEDLGDAGKNLRKVNVDPQSQTTHLTVKTDDIYVRPPNATTKAQREAVQGKPCVDCGETTDKMVADHKLPLVQEHYETGAIDKERMRLLDVVQPQCPTCSSKQGAALSKYSKIVKKYIMEYKK